MAVTLYRQVGKGKARRYQKVNLGRGRRPTNLAGPCFLRYSLVDGIRPWEAVGDDLDSRIPATMKGRDRGALWEIRMPRSTIRQGIKGIRQSESEARRDPPRFYRVGSPLVCL